jgi:hypothetical protein
MSHRFADSLHAGSGWKVFHPDPARKLSVNLYNIYHCCVYSEKLLMMDRGTVQNMQSRIRMELQFNPDPACKLSVKLYDLYHCCVYSEKLLMMDRGTV